MRSSRGRPAPAAAPNSTCPGTRLRTSRTFGALNGDGSSAPATTTMYSSSGPADARASSRHLRYRATPRRCSAPGRSARPSTAILTASRRSGLAPDGGPCQQQRVPDRRHEEHVETRAGQGGGSLLRRLGGPVSARGGFGWAGRLLRGLFRRLPRRRVLWLRRRLLLTERIRVLLVAGALPERRGRESEQRCERNDWEQRSGLPHDAHS